MSSSSLTIEQALALLAETPTRIATLTASLAPAQLRTATSHGEWSANDVLAHMRSFATQRAALLTVLEPLPPEAWARAATVRETGRTLERTVLSYAERLARHEQPHIEQIGRIVNAVRS